MQSASRAYLHNIVLSVPIVSLLPWSVASHNRSKVISEPTERVALDELVIDRSKEVIPKGISVIGHYGVAHAEVSKQDLGKIDGILREAAESAGEGGRVYIEVNETPDYGRRPRLRVEWSCAQSPRTYAGKSIELKQAPEPQGSEPSAARLLFVQALNRLPDNC